MSISTNLRLFLLLSVFAATLCIAEEETTVQASFINDMIDAFGQPLLDLGWEKDNDQYCKFEGVACDDGSIFELKLPNRSLNGTLPDSIAKLSRLEALELPHNNISSIPQVGSNHFYYLDMSNCNISGTFPESINVPYLKTINLSSNNLEGNLGEQTLNYKAITNLVLNNNSLSGSLPNSLTDASHLYRLDLSYNKFTGGVPSGIAKLPYLEILQLHHNNLDSLSSDFDSSQIKDFKFDPQSVQSNSRRSRRGRV
ncbi:uncharacterized protein LOC126316741 [Schistocerca gregaria]|uniref:uncharacterized protein LOC126316741 n=1 Tax=Schistocerca gregaria TaxID=7010 RepID=UPI00211EB8F5|nr:uncharacterized protein LOC126316741 [Schistocerca gregaria]